MIGVGKGPKDLPLLEYRVLYRLAELFPQHVPIEHAADLQALAGDFAVELDAMESIASQFAQPPSIELERAVKLQPIVATLQRQGLVESEEFSFGSLRVQPTFEGRQRVAEWRAEWKRRNTPWLRRTALPYLGQFIQPPNLLALLVVVLTAMLIPLGFYTAGKSPQDLFKAAASASHATPTPTSAPPTPRPTATPSPIPAQPRPSPTSGIVEVQTVSENDPATPFFGGALYVAVTSFGTGLNSEDTVIGNVSAAGCNTKAIDNQDKGSEFTYVCGRAYSILVKDINIPDSATFQITRLANKP